MLKVNVKRDACCVVAILTAIGFFSCGKTKEPQKETPVAKLPLVRTMVVPEKGESRVETFPIFAVQAQTVKLSFRVPGQLLEFDPIRGRRVAKDQVVARLDPRDYQLAVSRLQQGIAEANALLKAMRTGARAEDIAALESQILGAQTAAANAGRQLARMENLRADGTASEVQYDIAKTTSDAATAHLATLRTQLSKAKSGARQEEIEAMEAKIAGLVIDLELAKNKLADTELKAPFDAVIAEKYFDNHETVAPGLPVLELVDADAMEATLNVSEDIVRQQALIEKIECRFSSIPDQVYPAAVKEVGQTVQRGNLAYPLTVRIDLAADGDEKHLLPGMVGTAFVTIKGDQKSVTLPAAALIPGDGKKGEGADDQDNAGRLESAVWLYNAHNGALTRRPIRVSAFTEEGALVAEGLSGGETIVSAGARFLVEGQKVRTE